MHSFSRRNFIKAGLGGTAISAISSSNAMAWLQPSSYKALVVVFLAGGNDAFNMVIPHGSDPDTGYPAYRNSRADFSVAEHDLGTFTAGSNPYAQGTNSDQEAYLKGSYRFDHLDIGINAMMPELAQLLSDEKAAIVANVGTLVEPVTKQTLLSARLPPFLYAHNHQQRALQTGWADNLNASGWAGRMAELWSSSSQPGFNGGSPLGLNVSLAGETRLMASASKRPVVLAPGELALFDDNYAGFNTGIFKTLNSPGHSDPIQRQLRNANREAAIISELLTENRSRLNDFSSLNDPYGNPLFSVPGPAQLQMQGELRGTLLSAAHSAAQLIDLGRNTLGLDRQVIYIELGGFDTHADQLNQHPALLRELSLAMWSFQAAMDALNMGENVTLCTLSDFGRSLGNNGDGTDHGWAGHNLVMGGAVNGGTMIGSMPDLSLGGDSDTGLKGRMIPGIAIDQYLATLCHWLGVSDQENAELFPNLDNFRRQGLPFTASAYLHDLFQPTLALPDRELGLPRLKQFLKGILGG